MTTRKLNLIDYPASERSAVGSAFYCHLVPEIPFSSAQYGTYREFGPEIKAYPVNDSSNLANLLEALSAIPGIIFDCAPHTTRSVLGELMNDVFDDAYLRGFEDGQDPNQDNNNRDHESKNSASKFATRLDALCKEFAS